MDDKQILDLSKDQLNRSLTFLSRIDSQSSILLTINIAMLGFLSGNTPAIQSFNASMVVCAAVPLFLIGASLWNLYRGSFPQLEGGHDSLIYFREIAKKNWESVSRGLPETRQCPIWKWYSVSSLEKFWNLKEKIWSSQTRIYISWYFDYSLGVYSSGICRKSSF